MLQINVPYLTSAQLDQVVAELLRNYGKWRGTPVRPPIDVDEIAEGYLGLTLELTDLRQLLGIDDVLGATWFDCALISHWKARKGDSPSPWRTRSPTGSFTARFTRWRR
jgi:hypothetical protein